MAGRGRAGQQGHKVDGVRKGANDSPPQAGGGVSLEVGAGKDPGILRVDGGEKAVEEGVSR